jgi:hypothetical protein
MLIEVKNLQVTMKSMEEIYEEMEFPSFPMSDLTRNKLSKQVKQDIKDTTETLHWNKY